jgi:putative ubiquitin-RnfH superfamily antitoxin RatB of RatAB toxin-antitoxin module
MIAVEVVYCPAPGPCDVVSLLLEPGTLLGRAIELSGLLQRHGLLADGLTTGIWGRRCPLAAVLRDGDRVEIYRPLRVDPKEARRQRYRMGQRAQSPQSA